jgi:hypothetical protein
MKKQETYWTVGHASVIRIEKHPDVFRFNARKSLDDDGEIWINATLNDIVHILHAAIRAQVQPLNYER